MDVKGMRSAGMTLSEIAEATGYHRTTIAKWIRAGGPPAQRAPDADRVVLTDRWQRRIAELLEKQPALLSTSIHDVLTAEGFPHVVRHRGARGASHPRSTVQGGAGGVGADRDRTRGGGAVRLLRRLGRWGAVGVDRQAGVLRDDLVLVAVAALVFTTSEDREQTFESLVRFIAAAGGVPRVGRTDRMGALGTSQGRRFRLHPPAVAFAGHHGMVIRPCQARDAKRKGEVERPFRQLREGFLAEQHLNPPTTIGQLNDRAVAWLDRRVHTVAHRITKVPPAQRRAVERPLLLPLPPARFDTAHREPRRVHPAIPLISWRRCGWDTDPRRWWATSRVRRPAVGGRPRGASCGCCGRVGAAARTPHRW